MRVLQYLNAFALLVSFAGCSGGGESSVVMVPIAEDLPFADFDYQLIEKGESVSGAAWPAPIQKLHSYLAVGDGLTYDTLGVEHSGNVDLEFLADGRWILLDRERNELTEIDPVTGESIRMASQGDGPGELQFAMDAASIGQMVYVSRAGMAVSVFDCRTSPCKYVEDIGLGLMANSVAPAAGGGLAALGSAVVVGKPPDGENENGGTDAISLFDPSGQRTGAFGQKYNVNGHWMLNHPLVDEGEVHFIEEKGLYLVAFDNLPYLYFYDVAGGLVSGLKIKEFEQGTYEYDRGIGRLSNPAGDYSQIEALDVVGGEFVVLDVLTFRDRRMVDRQRAWTEERDTYVIDLGSMSTAVVGSSRLEVDFGGSGGSGGGEIFVGDRDLVINSRGRLVVVK